MSKIFVTFANVLILKITPGLKQTSSPNPDFRLIQMNSSVKSNPGYVRYTIDICRFPSIAEYRTVWEIFGVSEALGRMTVALPVAAFSKCLTCRYASNHSYPCWMCLLWAG